MKVKLKTDWQQDFLTWTLSVGVHEFRYLKTSLMQSLLGNGKVPINFECEYENPEQPPVVQTFVDSKSLLHKMWPNYTFKLNDANNQLYIIGKILLINEVTLRFFVCVNTDFYSDDNFGCSVTDESMQATALQSWCRYNT